ncbi:CocE/NonD family hydrolase [Streptomyces sp. NPDC091272]|uniref:CocE/NonD family hydrolase n=1 Tax=Streptomyces sp. NPDC091272 TaxID=3365981 RepID=UPI003809D939
MRASWRKLPAKRYDVGWEPGLEVPGADGSRLVTDHYFPRAEGDFPTLLVRSPYGRGVPWSPQYGILFAEQGFHVVLQSCRGTGGSGGSFHYWRNEASDGQAAVTWLRQQPWFNGVLGTVGPSYLGYAQWALALDPPPELKAMAVQLGLHDPHALFHAPAAEGATGALRLENSLAVGAGVAYQHRGIRPLVRAMVRLRRGLARIVTARPLRGAYERALGELPWLEGAMAHPDPGDSYWQGASLAGAAHRHRADIPVSLVTGWHDGLADQTFQQYESLRAAGCETALLVGPWTHTTAFQQGWPEVFAETLAWLRAHLCDDPSGLRPTAVRVHVGGGAGRGTGEGEWRDLDGWPHGTGAGAGAGAGVVPGADAGVADVTGVAAVTGVAGVSGGLWFPAAGGRLVRQGPVGDGPVASFRYDPDDPTPSVGGALFSPAAGARDNTALEARDDVRTFTGPPLAEALEVLGPVFAHLRISTGPSDGPRSDPSAGLSDGPSTDPSDALSDGPRADPSAGLSDSPSTDPSDALSDGPSTRPDASPRFADVFVRLCDVDPAGRSFNVCDGITSLRTAGDDPTAATVAMSSTAYRFAPGHRVRLQLSGGAHPRYARGSGTGQLPLDATEFKPVDITLHTGSALSLP